jgi:hypothetical protein
MEEVVDTHGQECYSHWGQPWADPRELLEQKEVLVVGGVVLEVYLLVLAIEE